MSTHLKRSILSGYVSNGLTLCVRYMVIPLYLTQLGVENWGIVSLVYTIQAMFVLLDLGIGTKVANYLAGKRTNTLGEASTAENFRSHEVTYWVMSMCILALGYFGAVKAVLPGDAYERGDFEAIVLVMSLYLGFAWPESFYSNGLLGIGRLPEANGIKLAGGILENAALSYYLLFIGSDVTSFLVIVLIFGCGQTLVLATAFWRYLGVKHIFSRGRLAMVTDSLGLNVGLIAYSALSFGMWNGCRVLIGKQGGSEALGTFAVALTVPLAMMRLVYPVSAPFMARVRALSDSGEKSRIGQTFDDCTRLVFLLAGLAIAIFALGAREVLGLWMTFSDRGAAIVPELVLPSQIVAGAIGIQMFLSLVANYSIGTDQLKKMNLGLGLGLSAMGVWYFYAGMADASAGAYCFLASSITCMAVTLLTLKRNFSVGRLLARMLLVEASVVLGASRLLDGYLRSNSIARLVIFAVLTSLVFVATDYVLSKTQLKS